MACGKAGLDELRLAAVVFFGNGVLGLGFGEVFLFAVVGYFAGALDGGHVLGVGGDYDLAAVRFQHIVNAVELVLRELAPILDAHGVVSDGVDVLGYVGGRRESLGRVGYDLSVFQLYDTVAVLLGKLAVVRNDDDEFGRGQLFERFENLLTGCGVERAGGFVRHDYFGLFYERAGDGDPLLLTAGQRVRFALAEAFEVDHFEQAVNRRLVVLLALELKSERNILFDVELVQNIVFLEHETYVRVAVAVEVGAGKVLAALSLDDDFAAVGRIQSARNVKQRGLTGSALTEQEHHTLFGKIHRYTVKRANLRPSFGLIDLDEILYG